MTVGTTSSHIYYKDYGACQYQSVPQKSYAESPYLRSITYLQKQIACFNSLSIWKIVFRISKAISTYLSIILYFCWRGQSNIYLVKNHHSRVSPSTLHPPIHQGLPHPRSSTLNKRILKREKRNCLSDTWHRSQTRTHEDCFFFTAWFWSEEGCDLTEGGLSGHWLPPPLYFCPRHRGAAQEVGHKNLRLTRDCLCLLELLLWVLINE